MRRPHRHRRARLGPGRVASTSPRASTSSALQRVAQLKLCGPSVVVRDGRRRRRRTSTPGSRPPAALPLHRAQPAGARPVPRPHGVARRRRRSTSSCCAWRATRSSASTTSAPSAAAPSGRGRCRSCGGCAGPAGPTSATGVLRFEIEATAVLPPDGAQHRRHHGGRRPGRGAAGDIRGILRSGSRAAAAPHRPARRACASGTCRLREPRAGIERCRVRLARRLVACVLRLGCPRADLDSATPQGRYACAPTAPRPARSPRKWYVVDAEGLVLGRLVHRGRPHPARQAQADLRAAHGHGRPRHHRQRREGRAHLQQGRAEARLPPLRLPGRPQVRAPSPRLLARKPEEAVRRAVRGHAPEEPPRSPDAHQAEGLRRPEPPPLGADARAPRPRRRPARPR